MNMCKGKSDERIAKEKIRLTISEALDTHCNNCPKVHKSDKSNYKYCDTQCALGQKLKSSRESLWFYNDVSDGWTDELDFYIAYHFGKSNIQNIAKQVDHTPLEIRHRFKYLQTITEFSMGRKHHAIRSGLCR
ncbi:hypothetical protein ACFPYN_02920 [Paenisporosarcina macmurdoensis]|uniref:Zinc-finger domain-containing protein n=1 Tax=Paenisporosarcina macmurdoensis TaxID=212659 RepID=A0ABW1L341_9BACL